MMNGKSILPNNFGTKKWFSVIIRIIVLTDLAIILDILYIRQILGFLFLTFLPGLLILQTLKLNKLELTEKFVLVVGLSISFLMLFGLLLNNSSLALGYNSPLSTISLLILFNLVAIVLMVVADRMNKNAIFSLPNFNLSTSEKTFLIVPIFFPALSIFGMHIMNTTNNNIILIFLLFLIPIYVASVCFFNQKFPERLYPVVVFLISISLVLMFALRSNHIVGVDRHIEYYYFLTTLGNLHWSIFGHTTLDACLCISLLPTIYQSILNISEEYLYKILIPLIFLLSPLIVYILSKKYIGAMYAFLASFFFMSQHLFVAHQGGRTNVAIFFFALAMMVLFNDKIESMKKRILFIVFMASCTVSHYSTTYIFFFVLLGTFVGMEILSKKYTFKKVMSLTLVILFFTMIFFWYSQVTETAFAAGTNFVKDTLISLQEFFVEESRQTNVQAMFGKDIEEKGIPHWIQFVLTWLTFAFIGIGVTILIIRHKEMSFSELNFKKPNFLRKKFEVEYSVIALACTGLLVAMIAFPHTSVGYSMHRLFAVASAILSVFFVIGGMMIAKYSKFDNIRGIALIRRRFSRAKRVSNTGVNEAQPFSTETVPQVRTYLIILLVLIPYFFCITGVMYQVFGYPRAITLNSEGDTYDLCYVHDQESYSARWLGSYADYATLHQTTIFAADFFGGRRLTSQGMIPPSAISAGSFIKYGKIDGYIYLRHYNVVEGKLMDYHNEIYNMTDYQDTLTEKNEIYDGGCSKIYR